MNQAELKKYQGYVRTHVKNAMYIFRGQLNITDLDQAAQAALCKAETTHDASKGAFSTHAWNTIRGAVRDEVRLQLKCRKEIHSVNMSTDESDEQANVADLVSVDSDVEDRIYRSELAAILQSQIEKLPPEEQQYCLLRFVKDQSEVQIGESMGLSRQRINQIRHATLYRLKKLLGSELAFQS